MPEKQIPNYAGPDRVFSGVQPSGSLHLGNYLGALKKFAKLQHEKDCVFCIVDLHAITVPQDPSKLADQTREIAAAYFAAGVDPKKAIVYAQSSVRAHTELAWYLNCVARTGWLNRMTQFKDKVGKNAERASVGLYTYPVSTGRRHSGVQRHPCPRRRRPETAFGTVPRYCAKFNHDFNAPDFFPIPEPLIDGPGAKVMSLRDGTKKMSKSDPADASRINLTDTPDQISKKIRKAKTDAGSVPTTAKEMEGPSRYCQPHWDLFRPVGALRS